MSGDVKKEAAGHLETYHSKILGVGKKFEQGKMPLQKNMQSEIKRKKIHAKDGPVFPQFCHNAQPRLQILVFEIIHLKVKL